MSVMPDSLWPHGLQRASLPCPSLSPGVCSNSCPLNYLTISSSAAPSSFGLQSFPASGSFPMSWLFTSGGQSIGASASASVLPMNIQDCFPLGLTGFIFLLSKELLRVFSSTTIWKHRFFSTKLYFGEGNGSPLQYLLPGKFHRQRSLAGYSLWGRKESDMTQQTYTHASQFVKTQH